MRPTFVAGPMAFDIAEDAEEQEQPLDPLSDLLFGLVAIVIPAVAVMMPLMQVAAGALPERERQAVVSFLGNKFVVDGKSASSILLGKDGLRLQAEGDQLVTLDRILDDPRLVAHLEQTKRREQPLLLLIEPDGQEAAFLLETVLAARGPSRVFQVRIDSACSFIHNPALFENCSAASSRRGVPR